MGAAPPNLESLLHALEAHLPGCVARSLAGVTLQAGAPLPLAGIRIARGGLGILSVVPALLGALLVSFSPDLRLVLVGAPLLGLGLVLLWMDAESLQAQVAALRARRAGHRGTLRALHLQPERLTLVRGHQPPLVFAAAEIGEIQAPAPGLLRLVRTDGVPVVLALPRADGEQARLLVACLCCWRDGARAARQADGAHAAQVQAALAPLRQRGAGDQV